MSAAQALKINGEPRLRLIAMLAKQMRNAAVAIPLHALQPTIQILLEAAFKPRIGAPIKGTGSTILPWANSPARQAPVLRQTHP
jgi:hypothetical protein